MSLRITILIGVLGICSCSSPDSKNRQQRKVNTNTVELQCYIDSSAKLYLEAINEVQKSGSLDSVRSKYAKDISYWHSLLSKSFDSLTEAYMNKVLTQEEYDNFRESLFLDSVEQRSERLKALGIQIDLNK